MLSRNDLVLCTEPLARIPLFDILPAAKQAGFDAISLSASHILGLERQGTAAGEVKQRVADCGLKVANFECITNWLPGHGASASDELSKQLAELTPERMVPIAAALGARSVSLAEISRVPVDLDIAAQCFGRVCDMARNEGLLAEIEFLPVGGIPSLVAASAIVERANRPNGGLMIDTLHFFRGGGTLEQLRTVPAERIITVQLADAPAEPPADLWAELMEGRMLPGEGGLDVTGVVRTLDEIGANAPIGIEIFSAAITSRPLDQTMQSWIDALKITLGQARASTIQEIEG